MPSITTTPTPALSISEQWKMYQHLLAAGSHEIITQATLNNVILPVETLRCKVEAAKFLTTDLDTTTMLQRVDKLADRPEPVLILGESGTGKELIANKLHGSRGGKFVAVNVCAVVDTLFESELFGHVKGSFTGAITDREGLISSAAKGTLFLDEIGDMPLPLQAKMLRVIQTGTYRKVGGNADNPLTCRIVAATHRDLKEMIMFKQFRLDLYERLNVFKVRIKPLRERPSDIELLCGKPFIEVLTKLYGSMEEWKFTGNVRQLLNLKQRYDVFGEVELEEEDIL